MLNLISTGWYKPPSGNGAEFEIRALNYREMLTIREMMGASELGPRDPAVHERALEMVVSGWRGVSEKFARDKLVRLPSIIVDELSAEIFARSALSGEQEKNLSSPSTSRRRESSSTAPTASTAAPAKKTKAKAKTSAGRSKPRRAKPSN